MKRLLIVAPLLFSASLVAQPKPVEAVVDSVNDRRTNGSFAELMVSVRLPKIRSSEVAASRVLVTAATDDTGANLVKTEEEEPRLEPNGSGMFEKKEDPPVTVRMSLATPSRKATKVKEIRGEVELFMPSKDPNSVADVSKFLSYSGKALNHKALKGNGVEIILLSKAQIEAEKKKIADAKRKEYKDAGYEDGEDLENNVKNAVEWSLNPEPSDVVVRIKDPKKNIEELEYVDAKGEAKRVHTRNLYEDIDAITTWGDAPGPGVTLRVKMKTAKNMVRYPFVVKDVTLP
jgi:hypothetical protein